MQWHRHRRCIASRLLFESRPLSVLAFEIIVINIKTQQIDTILMTTLLLLLKMPLFCRIITMLGQLMLTIAYCSFRWVFRFIQKIISFEMSRHNIDYIIAVYKRIKIYKFTTIAITCEHCEQSAFIFRRTVKSIVNNALIGIPSQRNWLSPITINNINNENIKLKKQNENS